MSSTEPRTPAGVAVLSSTRPTATRSPRERTLAVGSATLPVIDLTRQVVLLSLAALAYFGVRAITKSDQALAIAHAETVVSLERRLHLLVEGTLQGLIIGNHSLVTAANWYYIFGHWPVIPAALIWLYTRHRNVYRRLRNAMFVSGAIGLVIFWLYPVAPPRLTDMGLVDTVTKYSHAYRVLQPPAIEDRFASLPSLHVGWNLLVGMTLARTIRHRLGQVVAALSPLTGCDLTWACLRGCDLSGAEFTGALLLEADLRETVLHGADLSATPALDSVRWDGARCDRSTRWPRGFRPTIVGVTVETERFDH